MAASRVLMCSASMGAEGSVTLQLREAAVTQSPRDGGASGTIGHRTPLTATLDGSGGHLKIAGYPDSGDMLADMLGSIQAAGTNIVLQDVDSDELTTFSILESTGEAGVFSKFDASASPTSSTVAVAFDAALSGNIITSSGGTITALASSAPASPPNASAAAATTTTTASTTATETSHISSIVGSSTGNGTLMHSHLPHNIIISGGGGSSSNSSTASSTGSNSNSSHSSSNSSTCSNVSSVTAITSSSGNGTMMMGNNAALMMAGIAGGGGGGSGGGMGTVSTTTATVLAKKSRPKTASPTRHGPQQCQVCSKIFGNASALAKHKLTHSDERKYVCGMCSKAFKRQDHLNGHMLTHRNKKPYECKAEGCGKSYCDARSLRRHTENHHGAPGQAAATPATAATGSTATATMTTANGAATATGAPSGLSLSPATASGDASSPHGATTTTTTMSPTVNSSTGTTTIQYITAEPSGGTTTTILTTASHKAQLSPAGGAGNEGLTRQQLDLITQIMQQTKQATATTTVVGQQRSGGSTVQSAGHRVVQPQQQQQQQQHQQQQQQQHQKQQQLSQRPRTWNMQTQLQQTQQQKTATHIVVSSASAHPAAGDNAPAQQQQQQQISAKTVVIANSSTPNKQNHPAHALNGSTPTTNTVVKTNTSTTPSDASSKQSHDAASSTVVLAGPVECNLCQRKFKNTPALNGHMRLHGGYFKKDTEPKKCDKKEHSGPPLQTASVGIRALIEEKIISKRSKDLRTAAAAASAAAFAVPAPPLSAQRRLVEQQQQHQQQQQQPEPKIMIPSPGTQSQLLLQSQLKANNSLQPIADGKDATLIELLKRGTKVAVKRTSSDPGYSPHLFSTKTGAAPTTPPAHSSPITPLSISLGSAVVARSPAPSLTVIPASRTTSNGQHLTLAISQAACDSGDVFTLAYAADDTATAAYFTDADADDSDVYGVPDTAMLLQAVDSIHMLADASGAAHDDDDGGSGDPTGHHHQQLVDDLASLSDYTLSESGDRPGSPGGGIHCHSALNRYTPSRQLQAVLNSPLPESLAEFSALHSKDFILYAGDAGDMVTNGGGGYTTSTGGSPHSGTAGSGSPLASPLAYPTPPASHETVAHASPFLDDAHHFGGDGGGGPGSNGGCSLYSMTGDWLKNARDSELTDSERILRLKHELFQDSKSVMEDHVLFFRSDDDDDDGGVDGGGGVCNVGAVGDYKHNDADAFGVVKSAGGLHRPPSSDVGEFPASLGFLDDDDGSHDFLGSSVEDEQRRQHASSPLSAAFFSGTMSTAEQVKEALQEVLPNDGDDDDDGVDDVAVDADGVDADANPDGNERLQGGGGCDIGEVVDCVGPIVSNAASGEIVSGSDIDLYYLPALTLQSQMLSADDPLLSSSPKDFVVQHKTAMQTTVLQQQQQPQQQQQQQQQQLQPQPSQHSYQQQQQHANRFDFNVFAAPQQPTTHNPPAKRPRLDQHRTDTIAPHQQPGFALYGGQRIATAGNVPLRPPSPPIVAAHQPGHSATILRKRPASGSPLTPISRPYVAYRSKMRRRYDTTHFTPTPLLNPQRHGAGLYATMRSASGSVLDFTDGGLSSATDACTTDAVIDGHHDAANDDADDDDDCLDFDFGQADLRASHLNIGSDFQATLPAYDPYRLPPTSDRAQCLWHPDGAAQQRRTGAAQLQRFVELTRSSAVPLGCHSEETALQCLMEAGGSTQRAILSLLQRPAQPMHGRWQARDIEVFLRGLEMWGKDFQRIAKEIATKTTSDCVQLYYFWKKLSVDYKVTHLGGNDAQPIEAPAPKSATHPPPELRAHVCEMPDCSASFSSKAALHGHIRIHCIANKRDSANNSSNTNSSSSNNNNNNTNNNNNQHAIHHHHNTTPNHPHHHHNHNQQQFIATASSTTLATSAASATSSTFTTASQLFGQQAYGNGGHTGSSSSLQLGSTLLAQQSGTSHGFPTKDDYPCKVCGKVFNKVKSRSAHMKTHRPQDTTESPTASAVFAALSASTSCAPTSFAASAAATTTTTTTILPDPATVQ